MFLDNKHRSTEHYCFKSDEDLLMLSPFPVTTWLGFLMKLHSRSRRNIPGDGHCRLTPASPGCSSALPSRCSQSAWKNPKGRLFFFLVQAFLFLIYLFILVWKGDKARQGLPRSAGHEEWSQCQPPNPVSIATARSAQTCHECRLFTSYVRPVPHQPMGPKAGGSSCCHTLSFQPGPAPKTSHLSRSFHHKCGKLLSWHAFVGFVSHPNAHALQSWSRS